MNAHDTASHPFGTETPCLDDLHFNYALQVWVEGGFILHCAHPETGRPCCNASRLRFGGKLESEVTR